MEGKEPPLLYALMGPTGSGKTSLATSLNPERYEVVSCDSRQVYREMEIGTAHPEPEELAAIPHHCIGFMSPDRSVNAALYVRKAREAIEGILSRGRQPVLVGGTGFYYHALKTGLFESATPDPTVRERIAQLPPHEALQELRTLDPGALQPDSGEILPGKIHPNDLYRIRRALEVTLTTGEPWSLHWQRARERGEESREFRMEGWRIEPERDSYRERLLLRTRAMVERGLVEEAGKIVERYGPDAPGLKTLGYDLALAVLRGESDVEDLPELLARSHYRYGKKQITWFRREEELTTATPEELVRRSREGLLFPP